MRNRAPLTLGFSLVLFAPLAWAQSGPAFVRDHVYGPGGGVVMTAEPDTIAPSAPPNLTGSADSNDDVTLTWSAASDIGSGVAGYDVYQGTTLLGSTTSTSYYTTYCPGVNKYVQYQVKAYDQANNLGPASSVNVYLTKCTPKPPPGVSLLSGPSVPAAA